MALIGARGAVTATLLTSVLPRWEAGQTCRLLRGLRSRRGAALGTSAAGQFFA